MTDRTTPPHAWIIHGYSATPQDHWFGDLANRLSDDGFRTEVPALPAPQDPDPEAWAATLRRRPGVPAEDSAIVALSLGCPTTLHHLSTLEGSWRLGTLVLVAGFLDPLPALPALDDFVEHTGRRLDDGETPGRLAEHIGRIAVLRSDADPYVPAAHTDRLARLFGTSAQVVPGAGHFLASDGVTSLPQAQAAVTGNSSAHD